MSQNTGFSRRGWFGLLLGAAAVPAVTATSNAAAIDYAVDVLARQAAETFDRAMRMAAEGTSPLFVSVAPNFQTSMKVPGYQPLRLTELQQLDRIRAAGKWRHSEIVRVDVVSGEKYKRRTWRYVN